METEWKANTGYMGLFSRSVNTLLLARKISKAVRKLEKELEDAPWLDEDAKEAKWAALHRQNARMTHKHIIKYRGFLTKVGQAASMKAGQMPQAWVDELKSLQDELPISSLREVKQTIRADLGRPLEQIFKQFGDRPIASASVAQAHEAWLIDRGHKVCVKVQHRGVASMVGTDLKTVEFICKRAARYHPDAPDASDLIREWRRASREEVDFKIEAANALKAWEAIQKRKLNVGCVRPLPELCGRRVLTMAFIEGWKITDVDKLPLGTDREAIARPLVDAFAMLVFQEGLIHGDPHPGNVFCEKLPDGRLRAALLDWGIVQQMSDKERASAARWVLATLAQDRMLYIRSLVELGFEFDADADQDSTSFLSFVEFTMGSSAWMFRDAIPASAHMTILAEMQKQQDKADKTGDPQHQPQDASFTKVLSKIPGVVLFFLRGLEMLQNICGELDVPLPFAEIILKRALPVVQALQPKEAPRPMPAPPGCGALELAVRHKLEELSIAGALIGAQVCVHSVRPDGSSIPECRLTVGRHSTTGMALQEGMLIPLIDNTIGVLLLCFLATFQKPTVAGKKLALDLPISQVWPEFAQKDKGGVTIGELFQHRAGMARCFPAEVSLKGFCTETRIEQFVAAAPRQRPANAAGAAAAAGSGASGASGASSDGGASVGFGAGAGDAAGGAAPEPSHAVGIAMAAMLRRAMGHGKVAQSVQASLKPLGLHKDVAYACQEPMKMARMARMPKESFSVERVYEALEEKSEMLDRPASSDPWITWQELGRRRPVCTDPLLVNRDSLRFGDACLAGRGLRATAEAVSALFASDLVPEEVLASTMEPGGALIPTSKQEWHDLGAPLEMGRGGWRLFRVRRVDDGTEAVGYGTVDGSTGSVLLRLPGHSVAVLLTAADRSTRHAGPALLETVLAQLGWQPLWSREPPPGLPEKASGSSNAAAAAAAVAASAAAASQMNGGTGQGGGGGEAGNSHIIAELEAKVARLADALERVAPGTVSEAVGGSALSNDGEEGEGDDDDEAEEDGEAEERQAARQKPATLAGEWSSLETEGLDRLLEAFEVPAMVRALAVRARRSLKVELRDETVVMVTKTSMMGRTVEDTTTSFVVGEEFEGEQNIGGAYRGIAWWLDDDEADLQGGQPAPPEDGRGEDGGDDMSGAGARKRCLAIEKHFLIEDRELVLEERLRLAADSGGSRLAMTVTLRAQDDCQAFVKDAEEREILCSSLEASGLRLRRNLLLGDEQLMRTGRIISVGPGTAPSRLADVQHMIVPGKVTVRYDDLEATTTFQRDGSDDAGAAGARGARRGRRRRTGAGGSNGASSSGAGGGSPARLLQDGPLAAIAEGASDFAQNAREAAPVALAGCAMGAFALAWTVRNYVSVALQSLGRNLLDACENSLEGLAAAAAPRIGRAASALDEALGEADGAARAAGGDVHDAVGASGEFVVMVDRRGGDNLGADLGRLRSGASSGGTGAVVVVKRLRQEGLFIEWNAHNPEMQVRPRDIVLEVNGITAEEDMQQLLHEIRRQTELRIRLRRGGQSRQANGHAAPGQGQSGEGDSMERRPSVTSSAFSAAAKDFDDARSDVSSLFPRSEVSARIRATSGPGVGGGAAPSPLLEGEEEDSELGGFSSAAAAAAASSAAGVATGSRTGAPAARGMDEGSEVSSTTALALRSAAADAAGAPNGAFDGAGFAGGLQDPRPSHGRVALEVVGFDCSARAAAATRGGPILSNHFDLGVDGLVLEAPCDRGKNKSFRNAEAAFHALKFWALAGTFSKISGAAAADKHRRLQQHADPTFAGHGSAWQAMLAVLIAKFEAETRPAAALLDTGDAFLLARAEPEALAAEAGGGGSEGPNRLGLLLMLIRDQLAGREGWSAYFRSLFDLRTGVPLSEATAQEWRDLVGSVVAFDAASD